MLAVSYWTLPVSPALASVARGGRELAGNRTRIVGLQSPLPFTFSYQLFRLPPLAHRAAQMKPLESYASR